MVEFNEIIEDSSSFWETSLEVSTTEGIDDYFVDMGLSFGRRMPGEDRIFEIIDYDSVNRIRDLFISFQGLQVIGEES